MAKEVLKWVKPNRLISLENADKIKVDGKIYTAAEYKDTFYKDAWSYNKLFYQLYDANAILITTKP